MTPAEIRAARAALGLSGAQLARLLGVSTRAYAMWEQGARKVNPTAARAVGWFLAGFRPAGWPGA